MKIPGTNQARQRFIGRLIGNGTPRGIAGSEDADSVWTRMMAQGSKGAATGVQRTGTSAASSFPKLEEPSPDDIANGNYVIEGWRHLLRKDPTWFGYHAYTKIPIMENGRVKPDAKGQPMYERWGVLGKDGRKNQQVRNDPRNDKGKETRVRVSPEQREALRQRMQYFGQHDEKDNFPHPCPVCGSRYGLLDRNSNTFQYNMRFWNPAGPIPSEKAPIPALAPGGWKNEPNEQWYQPPKTSP